MTTAHDPGSRLTDELALLLAAVAEQAGPWLDRVAATEHGERSPICDHCPVCAVIALLRGEPNALAATTLDRLADVVALLRAVLADRWEPGPPHMPGFRPEPPPDRETSERVQRIPVRRRPPTP
ncbi:hypothetical protein ACOBQX_24855 [Actinokineospora sp. G85]|uniref:hypothetical protein n=1 Tax=Actinokineospora sp. G85 TaxID=3406626 RepID=UPI003C78F980